MATSPTISEEALARFRKGQSFNWAGAKIDGQILSEIIRECSALADHPHSLAITNAIIDGDVSLNSVGDATGTPIALQIIGSEIRGGFRARGSKWRQLAIAKTSVNHIDLPGSTILGDLLLEGVNCGWLELRSSVIGNALALTDSKFSSASRAHAIELSELRVGLSLKAIGLTSTGSINAKAIHVGGSLNFGAVHIHVEADGELALDLSGAYVGKELRLCHASSRRFEAGGIVALMSAEIGSLTMRGAKLIGRSGIALVGDHLKVRDTVDLGGLSKEGFERFESTGSIRLSCSRIGGQFQIYDAIVDAAGLTAITLDRSSIGSDLLVGHHQSSIVIKGGVSANSAIVGGRVILFGATLSSTPVALSMREAAVAGEVALYQSVSRGQFLLDGLKANKFSIDDLRIARSSAEPNQEGYPENYAFPEDGLLDFSFATISGNAHFDRLTIENGDIRLIGSRIGGGLQMSRVSVLSKRHAFVGQNARIGSDLQISGTPENPALFQGKFNLMAARIESDTTFVDVHFGSTENPVRFDMRGSDVGGGFNCTRTIIYGEFNASAVRVDQDFILNGSHFISAGQTACDLRTIRVGGVLQVSRLGDGPDSVEALLDGDLVADGAEVGGLQWFWLRLEDNSNLLLTNMQINRKLQATGLLPQGGGAIDLTGTSVPELGDALDWERDGWGGGRLRLFLDGFRYERLSFPAGRAGASTAEVRAWRRRWLDRQANPLSSRPAHQIAKILRSQGMFEASRLVLIDAFSVEGRASPTLLARALALVWGITFGFGLSGNKAFLMLILTWLLGVLGVLQLQSSDLLIATAPGDAKARSCGDLIDPFIFSADVMLPVLDLGQEKLCGIGLGPKAVPEHAIASFELGSQRYDLEPWKIWRLIVSGYALLGWLVVSLAIATWSGIFRRSGRE